MTGKIAPRLRTFIKQAAFWCLWPAIAVVAWGELTPDPPEETAHFWDKAEHFVAYFGLALLAVLGRARKPPPPAVIFLAAVALGALLEVLQALVGRDAEWGDVLANTIGAAAGTLLGLWLLRLARLVDRKRAD